ncbi:hypothetical protein Lfu02_70710 [Longispora fulva]|uniref:DUF4013 domain-containing protein n=1 Tax=Longispora fulva TaxID=619741 RepID=A0A8J7KDT0_9ACTN|nr:DUF4013 domain-containing protein [Longispora fulva]MBG6134385.1 hypothetical protein [Longispora fulva]GIG62699.1 hypothetical protein Lfu02_70710 [Longispora fulva]
MADHVPPAAPAGLGGPLRLRTSLWFPIAERAARVDVLIGAAWLLVPVVGWLLNLGHRVQVVHRLQHGQPAFPGWRHPGRLLRHGLITAGAMVCYTAPGGVLLAAGLYGDSVVVAVAGGVLFTVAVAAIPGFMTHYCLAFDVAELLRPVRALRRVAACGAGYWRAWGIALTSLAVSLLGLLAGGIGFAVTSVWFWQVAGFSFATVMSHAHRLGPARNAVD